MRKLILTLLISSVFFMVHAQDDFVSKMNEIKLSGEYFTAHNRGDTEKDAYEKCIKDLLAQLTPGQNDEAFVRKNAQRLTKSGSPCRVFLYLKKDAVPQKAASKSTIVFKKEVQTDETDVNQETTPSAPPAVTPKPEPPKTVTPKPVTPKPDTPKDPAVNTDKSLLARLVNDIKQRPTITNAYHSFKAKKDLGMVNAYGLLNNVSNTDNVYIVIYDATTQELISILSPTQSGNRKNLLTDAPDSFSNYHGVNAFWFTLE